MNNPFVSDTFSNIWLKHFGKEKKNYLFFKNLKFLKANIFLPVYCNVGENFTNGVSYNCKELLTEKVKSKVLLIYDVPTYFNKNSSFLDSKIKYLKTKQYAGGYTDFDKFSSLEEILQTRFKAKKRAEFKKFKKRLELCYNVEYICYKGDVSISDYDYLMQAFFVLLEKRYIEKGINNRNTSSKFQLYYKELIYKLINENKASLFVVKCDDNLVSMSINFHSEDIMFYAIPVFDTNYSKFNLGHISLMAIFDWCIENGVKKFDFSKGDGIYKDKWITNHYHYENHIIYNSKSLISSFLAKLIFLFFNFKQFLRDKNFNSLINKIYFKGTKVEQKLPLLSKEISFDDGENIKEKINSDYQFLLMHLNLYVYDNSEKLLDVKILQSKSQNNLYQFLGKNSCLELRF
mgnify:CR=1 FL=1